MAENAFRRARWQCYAIALILGIAAATCPPSAAEVSPTTPPVSNPTTPTTDPSNNNTSPANSGPEFMYRSPTDAELREIYKFRYQTGVNFGGIFALERWMNFGVFAGLPDWVGTSQDAFNRGVGNVVELKRRLEDLWANYIPECDYEMLAHWGINTIRLPVGYWVIGGKYPDVPMLPPFQPFTDAYVGAEDAIHRVFTTAAKYGMGVLLDLHGAPGSQNGADHSGVSGPTALYGSAQNRQVTVATLGRFAQIYGNYTNLVGIELLNEPRDDPQLGNIYKDAYAAIRAVDSSIPIYICDTVWTSNWNKWADFIVNNGMTLTGLDVHKYYCFNGGGTPADSYINGIRTWERDTYRNLNNRVPVIVGEWSNAFDGGSYGGYDQQRRDGSRRNFGAQQLETHKLGAGNHFWSFRGDWADGSDWDFRWLNKKNWFAPNYYPFPGTQCAARKNNLVGRLNAQLPTERAAGLASHKAYWMQTNPQGSYDWTKYEAGFTEGYTTGMKFFWFADSRISSFRWEFANYKSRLYGNTLQAAGNSTSNVWQYRDGFSEGAVRFANVMGSLGA